MPGTPFSWTHAGNYPAGANPWNGQPLSVAPGQRYFTPGTKIPAENLNEIFGEIADDSSYLHTAVGTYRFLNQWVQENGTFLGAAWSTTTISVAAAVNYTVLQNSTITDFSGSGVQFQSTDYVEIEWMGAIVAYNGSGNATLPISIAASIGTGTLQPVPFNETQMWSQAAGYPAQPFFFKVWGPASDLVGNPAGTLPGTLNVALMAAKLNGGDPNSTVSLYGPSLISVKQYRPN